MTILVLESLNDFLQNVQNIYPLSFSFSIKNEKKTTPPHLPPFWVGGGSSATSSLKIWDVMPPYLKILFEQKTEI